MRVVMKNMALSDINDRHLVEHLAGRLSLSDLAAGMTGTEPYEIVGGMLQAIPSDVYRGRMAARISAIMADVRPVVRIHHVPGTAWTATAMVSRMVLHSKLWQSLVEACRRAGGTLTGEEGVDGYVGKWKAATNWATWGVKWKSEHYRSDGKNVLYVENGLLRQSSGVYIDSRGYFCDASFAGQPAEPPTHDEVSALQAHVTRHLGPWFHGGDRTGPVMVALQMARDGSVLHHYFPGRESDISAQLIRLCREHLPAGTRVIVRPHPHDPAVVTRCTLPEGWEWDHTPNVYATLLTCRGLVTITSTLATEAVSLGLPVACLGRGCWVGHGVVVECSGDFAKLRQVLTTEPDEWTATRFLCAVMRHQLPYDATPEQVAFSPAVREWIARAGGVVTAETSLEDATAWIMANGTAELQEHTKTLLAEHSNCQGCRRKRYSKLIGNLAIGAGMRPGWKRGQETT